MNQRSKYIKLSLAGMIALTLSSSVAVGAVTKSTVATTPKESAFCTNLAATITKVDTNMASVKAKLAATRTTRDQAITSDHTKWDQQLTTDRAKWDQQRLDNFTKLEARAKTTAQTAAIKTYEGAITSAVTARRSANDTVRATFRASVDNTLTAQRSTVDAQVATFGAAVASAEATAQAGCQATPSNGPALRTAFQSALKSAREAYTSQRKTDSNTGSQIKQLAATRDASFHTNDAAFKTATSSARDTLKAAFGSNV